jgi:hypothetical protein
MKKIAYILAAALTIAVTPARADGGAFIAGVIGGVLINELSHHQHQHYHHRHNHPRHPGYYDERPYTAPPVLIEREYYVVPQPRVQRCTEVPIYNRYNIIIGFQRYCQ